MKQKYIIWVFAAAVFLATLGITSWRNGLLSSDKPGAQPGGAAASRAVNMPEPMPQHPFQAAAPPPAAPPPAQITQSPPQPVAENIPSPTQDTQERQDRESTAPDPAYEQSQDDYKQRAKLMEEIAARGRTQQPGN